MVKITVSFYSALARYFQSLQYAGAASSESPSCTSLAVPDVEVHYSFNMMWFFRHSLDFLLEIGMTTYLPDFLKAGFACVIRYL